MNPLTTSKVLKALAHPVRVQIVTLLADGELTAGAINAQIAISQPCLSQHLQILRRRKLVRTRRDARHIYYSIVGERASRLVRYAQEVANA